MKKEMNNKGFSLVELIIVIAIMAVLMGILAPQYLKYVRKSKVSTDITNAEEVATRVNAAVADGELGSCSVGVAATKATVLYSDGTTTVNYPDSKLTPGASWNVTANDTDGVKQITLNGTIIWPDSSAYK